MVDVESIQTRFEFQEERQDTGGLRREKAGVSNPATGGGYGIKYRGGTRVIVGHMLGGMRDRSR